MPLSPEDEKKRQEAIQLRLDGTMPAEIAEKLGEPKVRIQSWLTMAASRRGVKYNKQQEKKERRTHTPEFKAEVISHVTAVGLKPKGRGESLPGGILDVATKFNLPPSAVRRWYMEAQRVQRRAKKAGVQLAHPQFRKGPPGKTKVILGEVDEGTELEQVSRERDIFMAALEIMIRRQKK